MKEAYYENRAPLLIDGQPGPEVQADIILKDLSNTIADRRKCLRLSIVDAAKVCYLETHKYQEVENGSAKATIRETLKVLTGLNIIMFEPEI